MTSACCLQQHDVGAVGLRQGSHYGSQNSEFQPRDAEIGCVRFLSPNVSFAFSPSTWRCRGHQRQSTLTAASLRSPSGKGFGKKVEKEKKMQMPSTEPEGKGEDEGENFMRGDEEDDDVIPEVVTNRMLKRIALTVGVPLGFGILLFPLFYYLKVVTKLDVPEWLPLFVSLFTFGTAGFGITYGVVSSSWDPAREGSFWGWKEAQVNWPLIWDKTKRK